MKLTIELIRLPPQNGAEENDICRTWEGIDDENMTLREKQIVRFLDNVFNAAMSRLPVVAHGQGETDAQAKLSLEIDNDIRRRNQQ
jgi:hypothetical protein